MQHFLYKITNKLNGRYYVGMHSTKNPDDGYLGSGRRIKAEVKKYGKENFEKVILEELLTRKALEDREREIVNEQLLEDPLCLNLKNGGEGGGRVWSEEHRLKLIENGRKTGGLNWKNLSEEQLIERAAKRIETQKQNGTLGQGFKGRKHSEETKAKMRATRAKK